MGRSKTNQKTVRAAGPGERTQTARSRAVIEQIEPRLMLSAASATGSLSPVSNNAITSQAIAKAAVAIPATPVFLAATAVSASEIDLTWATTDSLATSYLIQRSVGGGAFTQIATTSSKSYKNTGLTSNVAYTYRVSAKNTSGTSVPTAGVTATTKLKAPAAPTGVSATAASASQINLAWSTSDALATGFIVERSLNGTTFTTVATVATKTYSDTGLAASTKYAYRISAKNAAGTSAASSKASATTKAAIPAAPISLTATAISVSQINLTWATSDSFATGYLVQRSTNGTTFTQIASVTAKSYSDTGLAEGATYIYRVIATNAAGSSAVSATATAATLQRPAGVTQVVATLVSAGEIDVTWSTTDALATGYVIERSADGAAFARVGNVATKIYKDTALANGSTYAYRVTAYNVAGSSPVSATATVSTLTHPLSVTGLTAAGASIGEIDLDWSAGDALATGYLVERSSNGSAFAQVADVTTTSFSDTGLAEGATYTYRVTAYNAVGPAPSVTASAATLQRPGGVAGLTASGVSIGEIDLNWSGAALATGYLVEQSTDGQHFAQVADVTNTGFADPGLAEGTSYTFRVTAFDTAGVSPVSVTTAAATLQRPAGVSSLAATPVSVSRIDLSWSPGDTLATGYTIERSADGTNFTKLADVTAPSYSAIGLAEGASYTFCVTAFNAGGASPVGAMISAATLQRPGSVNLLAATPVSIGEIDLTWTPGDAVANGFIIERSDGGQAFHQIADLAGTSFNDTGLAEGATYTYRVTAYNAAGLSPLNSTATAATLQRPGTPGGLVATGTGINQITVKWTPADSLATDFVLERSIDSILFTQVADVSGNTFTDSGLLEGVTYDYRITARNAAGSSATSDEFFGKTLQRPATPTGLAATIINSSQINLKWIAADAYASGFTVERSVNSGAYSQIANITGTTYSDTTVATLNTYAYRVTAYNANGSLAGAIVTTTIKSPGTPTTVAAVPVTTKQAKLTWKAADALATDYIVERSTNGGASFTQVADVTAVTYTDSAVTAGASYTYRVTAHNALGSSAASAVASVTLPVPPLAVQNLTATTISANEIDLTWWAGDAITTGYLVERSLNNGATFATVTTVTSPSFNDTGLVGSTTYVYRITATTAYGSSMLNPTIAATTLQAPPAPTGVIATTASTTEVDLAWSLSDASATGYFIQRATNFGAYVQIATIPVSADMPTPTTFSDTGLAQNTIYTYRVAAFNDAGYAASAVAQTTTLADPTPAPPSVQPSATNTGVVAGVTLTTMGAFKPKSNTTYSNLMINGQVTLTNLTNVKFINCVIDGGTSATYDIRCDGASNITIQNCELRNAASAGIYGDGFTAINNYIHQISGDGFKAGKNVLIYGNYVSDLGFLATGAHADGIQIISGSHVIIVGNFFNLPIDNLNTDSNSSLFLQGTTRDVIFANNWVLGGNFAIHAYADGGGGSTVQIVNNVFYTGSTRYGFGSIDSAVIWMGNLTDTGLVALPMGL